MRTVGWIAVMAGMLMLAACYPLSLQPLFTDGDVTVDAGLVGVWQSAGGEERWTVEAPQGREYRVTRREGNETERLVVRLGRLGEATFLEMRGEKDPDSSQAIPAHSFWRVKREGDNLEVRPLKPEYFAGLAQAGKLEIGQVVRRELVVFTGTTAQVRAFLLPQLEEAEMYQETERYRRMEAAGK